MRAIVLLLLWASGQIQTQGPRHTVTGTVNNAVTGEPIRRALVQMSGQTQGNVLTGPDGRFRLEDVQEGQVWFNVQKPGFFDSRSPQNRGSAPPENHSFAVGSGTNDFQLKLYPSAHIVGHVTDQDGEPVENVSVQVIAEQIIEGRKRWQRRNGSSTDDDGTFRLEDLTPGRYVLLSGGHVLPALSWNAPREVSPPMYYPDAADLTSAQAIELQPGQEFQADFRLRTERGYRVVAQVGGMPNNVGVGPTIEDASGQRVQLGGTRFDRTRGQFTADAVPSGTWTLIVSGADREGHQYQARQEFTVDHADVTGLQVLPQPNASIPLTVNHSTSQDDNQPQDVPRGVNNLQAQLESADPSRPNDYRAQIQGDPPSLEFLNIPAGKYKLKIRSFGNECVESATYGGTDLTRDYLIVGPGGSAQPISINMRSDCSTLSITIKPGEHAAGTAYGVLVPSSSFAEPIVQPLSIPPAGQVAYYSSQFTLSPGTYQVFAFSNIDGLEYANPETLRNYSGQSITVDAGQQRQLTVELTERKEN